MNRCPDCNAVVVVEPNGGLTCPKCGWMDVGAEKALQVNREEYVIFTNQVQVNMDIAHITNCK